MEERDKRIETFAYHEGYTDALIKVLDILKLPVGVDQVWYQVDKLYQEELEKPL